MALSAQNPITPDFTSPIQADTAFQIKYAGNLQSNDAVFNISNSGGAAVFTCDSTTTACSTANPSPNICVNVYTFSPDEQLISCCACNVTPNGLVSLSARQDLISNTLTPAVPASIVVKLLATTSSTCNAASPGQNAVSGLVAWGTSAHAGPAPGTYSIAETPFVPARLSPSELQRITSLCGFIQSNGSGYGICKSCRSGALGGVKQ